MHSIVCSPCGGAIAAKRMMAPPGEHPVRGAFRATRPARSAFHFFSVALRGPRPSYRGRNAHYCVPPAQIPASGIPAPGSHLGCLTAKRWFGQG